MMTPRERVLAALRHEEPDRVPLFYRDVPEVDRRLQKDLGLNNRDELLEHLGIDFRWVEPRYVGPPLKDRRDGYCRDIWGVEYRYVAAGHGGHWEPLELPLSIVDDPAALDDYPWPSLEWFDFSALDEQLDMYSDYAVMTAPGPASPGVQATIINLLGIERTMMDMLLNPDFYLALSERILRFNLAFIERFYAVAGERVDLFRVGEDYGTQRGLLFGIKQWDTFVQPTLAAMTSLPKRHGSYYYHHTCGAVRELIPRLIEAGVDVLDPVQVKADGMDPAELKAEFGDRLCFSGGVDEQDLLPRGTPEEVGSGVRRLLDVMAPGGGFFVGPTHNFQCDIPTENILAMYEAAGRWRY